MGISDKEYLILKYTEGDVFKNIAHKCGHSLSNIGRFIKAMFKAVDNIHAQGVSHGDAHLGNFLFHGEPGT
jgi:serine/threonine protein kinase